MELLKGAPVCALLKEQVNELLEKLEGEVPQLAIVRVGEKPDDISYEKNAIKRMEAFGLQAKTYVFAENISDTEFKEAFRKINSDPQTAGLLLLRPLPAQICEKDIEEMIDPKKDLDGISPANIAKVFAGDKTGFAPCTAEAVVELLKANHIDLDGANVTVIGRSMVVGRPLSMLLLKENATVTVCHTHTKNLSDICRQAQILVAAAGRARMVDNSYVGQDAVVIDVGINVDENGRLCGDVNTESLEGTASKATPVPGGVGAVTTAVLAKHLVLAAVMQKTC